MSLCKKDWDEEEEEDYEGDSDEELSDASYGMFDEMVDEVPRKPLPAPVGDELSLDFHAFMPPWKCPDGGEHDSRNDACEHSFLRPPLCDLVSKALLGRTISEMEMDDAWMRFIKTECPEELLVEALATGECNFFLECVRFRRWDMISSVLERLPVLPLAVLADADGQTALHAIARQTEDSSMSMELACSSAARSMILIDCLDVIDVRTHLTAAQTAALTGNITVLQILTGSGADLRTRYELAFHERNLNASDWTALDFAMHSVSAVRCLVFQNLMRRMNLSSILLLRTQPSVCAGFLAEILGSIEVKRACERYILSSCCTKQRWDVKDAFGAEIRVAPCYEILLSFKHIFPREVIWRIIEYAGILRPREKGNLAQTTRDAVARGREMAAPYRQKNA